MPESTVNKAQDFDRGSLNCSPGISCCGSSRSMVAVAVEAPALAGILEVGCGFSRSWGC